MCWNKIEFNKEQFWPMGDNEAPYECEDCNSSDCKGCPVPRYWSTLTEALFGHTDVNNLDVKIEPIKIGIFSALKGAFLPKKLKKFLENPSEKNISLISNSPKFLYRFYKKNPELASNIFTFGEWKKVAELRPTYGILCEMIHSMWFYNEDANTVSVLIEESKLSTKDKKDLRELLSERLG